MEVWEDTRHAVEARAPGKVIISGEHAVVHGTSAVAAALNRYTTVRINLRPATIGDTGALVLSIPQLNLRLEWLLLYIKQNLGFNITEADFASASRTEDIKAKIEEFVEKEMPSTAEKGASSGVAAFLFLYVSILGLQPMDVNVTSDIPVGAGLGSSAAFCVAVTGAMLAVTGKLELQAKEGESKWMDICSSGRDLINTWAFEGEKIIHGRPSGVDNNVSCYGHVVRFKKGNLTRLRNPLELQMLVTNTNVSRNTKALVAGVAERADRHPAAMAAVFNAVEAISEEVVSLLEGPISEGKTGVINTVAEVDTEKSNPHGLSDGLTMDTNEIADRPLTSQPEGLLRLTRLKDLMAMNQGLLQCMGVSHPAIEAVCQITAIFGLTSKLTGAGGGGCVLTLLPNDPSHAMVANAKTQLELSGYHCFEAGIGGTGVQIGYPTGLPHS